MFGTSWRVARVAGVEVRVDSSWVVIALLITYSMYLRFSVLYQDLSTWAAAGIAILAAVLFFGSVLVHELAHALVSKARGIRVQDITLFLFGGATRARVESRGPGDEFLIADRDVRLPWLGQPAAGRVQPGPRIPAGRRAAAALGRVAGHRQLPPGHPDRLTGRPGGGMAAGGWRRSLPAGRQSCRRHLVRVHRLVPRPGRPSLLPGPPGPADAARGPSTRRDGRPPAADPAGPHPAGRRGPLLHALRPQRVPGGPAGPDDRPADPAAGSPGTKRPMAHQPGT